MLIVLYRKNKMKIYNLTKCQNNFDAPKARHRSCLRNWFKNIHYSMAVFFSGRIFVVSYIFAIFGNLFLNTNFGNSIIFFFENFFNTISKVRTDSCSSGRNPKLDICSRTDVYKPNVQAKSHSCNNSS